MWPHHSHYGTPDAHQVQLPVHPGIGNPMIAQPVPGQGHDHQQAMHSQQQLEHRQLQQQQFLRQQQRREHPMGLTASSHARASRNLAEKHRRDNLNSNITSMASLVPAIAGSPRRLDKISILRLAAAYMRTSYVLGSEKEFLPTKFNKLDLEKFLFETLTRNDGFMIVVTATGKIVYVGRQVEQHLGHVPADLFGQSLYDFVYPDDREELTKNLTPNETINLLTPAERTGGDENSRSSEDSRATGSLGMMVGEERRSFNIRMAQRVASKRESPQYECLHVSGLLRPAEACKDPALGIERAKKNQELDVAGNDIIFVGIARMMKRRITEVSLLEANKEEYVTRHLLDGRIIFCDHRISVVAGYMTREVSGVSAFKYMHSEDVLWTIIALRQMYDRREGFGSSCYRLKTKTGEYIYLRTHAYIEVDTDRKSFVSFICVNTSVSKEEGEKLSNEMKARYSATIKNAESFLTSEEIDTTTQSLAPKVALEDPSQLEDAISHLTRDFAAPQVADGGIASSPLPDMQSMKAVIVSQHLPPPEVHASEVGIKTIDRPSTSTGKGKTIKREADVGSPSSSQPRRTNNSTSFDDSLNQEESNISGTRHENKITPETSSTTDDKQIYRSQSMVRNYYKIEPSPGCSSTISNDDCSSRDAIYHKPTSPMRQVARPRSTIASPNRGKPDSMFVYIKTEKVEYGQRETMARSKSSIKRSNVDGSSSLSTKKRRGSKNVTYSTNATMSVDSNDSSVAHYDPSAQCVPFGNYNEEQIIDQESIHFKMENLEAPENGKEIAQLRNDLPCSSFQDLPIDCHPLNPSNVELSVYEDDFPDLQGDPFLGPDLDENPDFMKIFDDLGPVIGFEKSLTNRTLPQYPSSDHAGLSVGSFQQAVSEGLQRTHMELANRMSIQKNELCVLEHELETPTLQSSLFKPRDTLIELRAEHTKNTRMLKTIQQDHLNNMQTNSMKQNIGV